MNPAKNAPEPQTVESDPWTRQIHPLLDHAIQQIYGLRPVDYTDSGVRAAVTFRTIGALAERWSETPGRKTIVWITRGVPNWVEYPYGCRDVTFPGRSGDYLAGSCSTACRSLRGKCIDYTPFFRRLSTTFDRSDIRIDSVEEFTAGAIPFKDRGTPEDTLHHLAELTGAPLYPDGQTEKAIVNSLEDAPPRYQISYQAPPTDGKYHKLRVECVRKGVRVESRRGYYADLP